MDVEWVAPETVAMSVAEPRRVQIPEAPQISNVVGVTRRDDGALFVLWYRSGGGDQHTAHTLVLNFWCHGISGDINCDEATWAVWRGDKPVYRPKRDWPTDASGYPHNPNWAVRGSRGASARYGWQVRDDPVPDVRVSSVTYAPIVSAQGHWSASVSGVAADFERFVAWLDAKGPELRTWIVEDMSRP
jgi:hypothetical protein